MLRLLATMLAVEHRGHGSDDGLEEVNQLLIHHHHDAFGQVLKPHLRLS